jgi:hypothetical protein
MQRVCLAILRFCLSAWVGIAVFFVTVIIGLRQSTLFAEATKFDHPKVLFPVYYGFELATLGTALACAGVGLWNERIGRARRYAIAQLVIVAAALALWDYAIVYRDLLEMMNGPVPLPASFHELHRLSRRLNEAIVGAIATAAILAIMPEKSAQS